TDASVYQIQPLGVVIPKTREDILRALEICRRLRCPITMRGGGTSQAGQAIGAGIQIDISKYYNRLLEVNAEERWARVEPGTVLRLACEHADEVDRRFPKILRRVGGYNLDEFTDSSRPVNLAKIMVGSEGTLGIVLEAKLKLVPLPKAKAVMVIMFADLLEA